MKSKYFFAVIRGLATMLLLSACSGGGNGDGDGNTPPPGGGTNPSGVPTTPTLALGYGIKQLKFTWGAVSGATYYQLLENPDGVSGYTQVGGNITATSYEHEIFLPQRVNSGYMLNACNNAGCAASSAMFTSTGLVAAIGYVKASNTGKSDFFGYPVALNNDGNTLAIGAFGEASNATGINGDQSSNSAMASGAVYVYTRSDGGAWTQQAYIKASNTGMDDGFGSSVALSGDGNTLAVGAWNEDSNATGINGDQSNNGAIDSGAVYVYIRSGTAWTQQAYVKASNTGAGDVFSYPLALSSDGNTLAVGAWIEASNAIGINGDQTNNSVIGAGAVYIYTRSGGAWAQQAYVKASNTEAVDFFGYSLALSGDGNTLAVGALNEDSNATGINGDQSNNGALDAGAVYVYIRSSGAWTQQAYVKASNTGAGDEFGFSVALSGDGNTLAVGAWNEASNATGINGDHSNNGAIGSGAVYVYIRSSGTWTQQAYVKASNTGAGDEFGSSVALSGDGNTLAVGAWNEDSNAMGINGDQSGNSAIDSGAVYVYTRSSGAWSQQAYIKASNTGIEDGFGFSVALSDDGNTLAVGADGEDSNATGIGGDQSNNSAVDSGGVYLY